MHMSLQQSNEASAIAGLVIGTFAAVLFAAFGAMTWQVGTQEANWYKRVVSLGLAPGFWLLGGTIMVAVLEIFLNAFHWVSPAQTRFLDQLISDSFIFSLILVVGGSALWCAIDGGFEDKKP